MKRVFNVLIFILIVLLIVVPTKFDVTKIVLLSLIIITGLKPNIPKIYVPFFIAIGIILFYNLITFFRGYLTYGSLSFSDFKVFVIYFLFFTILQLTIRDTKLLSIMDFAIKISAFIINIYLIVFTLCALDMLPFEFWDILEQDMFFAQGYGFFKIYGLNTISYSFITPYIIASKLFFNGLEMKKIYGGKTFNNVNFYLTLISTILTLRRAYVLATIITIIILYILLDFNKKKAIMASASALMVLILFIYINPNYYYELRSSFDFVSNRSNQVRISQFYYMLMYIKEKPIFGYGYGFHMPEMIRNTNLVAYELQYIKLLATSGIVGLGIYMIIYYKFFKEAISMIKSKKNEFNFLIPALSGQIAVLIANAFNPILSQFSALIFLFYPIYVFNILKRSHR